MNVKLLKKVVAAIRAEPRRIDMNVLKRVCRAGVKDRPRCGTIGCIAGWTMLLTRRRKGESIRRTAARIPSLLQCEWEASELLEINIWQAHRLFYTMEWPEHRRIAYLSAGGPAGRARVVVARINAFIKSKGRH